MFPGDPDALVSHRLSLRGIQPRRQLASNLVQHPDVIEEGVQLFYPHPKSVACNASGIRHAGTQAAEHVNIQLPQKRLRRAHVSACRDHIINEHDLTLAFQGSGESKQPIELLRIPPCGALMCRASRLTPPKRVHYAETQIACVAHNSICQQARPWRLTRGRRAVAVGDGYKHRGFDRAPVDTRRGQATECL